MSRYITRVNGERLEAGTVDMLVSKLGGNTMIDFNMFQALSRTAKTCFEPNKLSEAEFNHAMADGEVYELFDGVSALFYAEAFADHLIMCVDASEVYQFKTYQEYLDLVESWKD